MNDRPPVKVISLHVAAAGLDPGEFRRWFLDHHAQTVRACSPRLRRYVVNLVDVPTSRGNARAVAGFDRAPAYDVIAEMWFDELRDFTDPARRTETAARSLLIDQDLACRTSRSFAYRVTEWTEMDRDVACVGGRTAGTKCISSATFFDRHDTSVRRKWWDDHVAGTCENLPGLLRYRRNVVEEALTPGAPPEFGIGELQYESLFHAEHIPVQPDVAEFLDFERIWTLDCSEYVVK